MIEKEAGTFIVYCDDCSCSELTEKDEFFEAVGSVKKKGWQITRGDHNWHHRCPDCAASSMFGEE